MPVRKKVAKSDGTSLIPILAKMVVNEVASAAINANISQSIFPFFPYNDRPLLPSWEGFFIVISIMKYRMGPCGAIFLSTLIERNSQWIKN